MMLLMRGMSIAFQSTRPRGARLSGPTSRDEHGLFQSTRPRGARQITTQWHLHSGRFQSTRPRGARLAFVKLWRRRREVSIHAPAWGATKKSAAAKSGLSSFNPRARVGRDIIPEVFDLTNDRFQSTRPRGARPDSITISILEA